MWWLIIFSCLFCNAEGHVLANGWKNMRCYNGNSFYVYLHRAAKYHLILDMCLSVFTRVRFNAITTHSVSDCGSWWPVILYFGKMLVHVLLFSFSFFRIAWRKRDSNLHNKYWTFRYGFFFHRLCNTFSGEYSICIWITCVDHVIFLN